MTEFEFAILLFGIIISTLVVVILMCIIIFKYNKRHTKQLTNEEFREKLSQNKNMYEVENQISRENNLDSKN